MKENITSQKPGGENQPQEIPVESESPDELSNREETVNLREAYPLAYRSIFSRTWRSILVFLGMLVLLRIGVGMAATPLEGGEVNANPLLSLSAYQIGAYYIFYAVTLLLSLRLFYEHLYHMSFYYGIEAEHFILTTGVLLKNRTSIHISLITDVFLQRRPEELVLGLYSVELANPSPEAPTQNRIASLDTTDAVGLQDFVVGLIEQSRVGPEFGDHKSNAGDVSALEKRRNRLGAKLEAA